jgi:hypothetical protein
MRIQSCFGVDGSATTVKSGLKRLEGGGESISSESFAALNDKGLSVCLGENKQLQVQKQRQMRGFFASLRMTARTGNGNGNDNDNGKGKGKGNSNSNSNSNSKGNGLVVSWRDFGKEADFFGFAAHMVREQLRSK